MPSPVAARRSLGAWLVAGALLAGVSVLDAPRSAALSFEGQETRLARELREGVAGQRVTAASELSTLAPGVAWPLVQLALADPEIDVRRHAASAAEDLGLVGALELTRPWLESDDEDLREIAVHAEGALGDASSVAVLSRALGDARFSVRSAAAEALGRLGLEACATPLGTALEDTDASVRMVAARALGHTPGDEAARALLARSLDPVLEVRVRVVEALAERGSEEGGLDGRVGAVLIAALADDAEEVRVAAILGLARARHGPAAPLLARLLDDTRLDVRTRDDDRDVRAAIAALGRIDVPDARGALVRALARGVALASTVRAIRAQLALAPEPMEQELSRALQAASRDGPSQTMARVLGAMVQLESLRGSDDILTAILSAREDRTLADVTALPALGALMPRTAGTHPSTATEAAVVALLAGVTDDGTVGSAIDGLERAAGRGVLDPRAVEVLLLPEVLPPSIATSQEPSADDEVELERFSLIDSRAARVIALLGRLDDARATSTLLAIATGREGPPRRAALIALARSSHVAGAALAPVLDRIEVHLASADAEERLAVRTIAARHADEGTIARLLAALASAGSLDRAAALEVVVARLAHLEEPARGRAEAVVVESLASTDAALSSAASSALVLAPARPDLANAAAERVRHHPARGDRRALARASHAVGCETEACAALDAVPSGAPLEVELDPLARGLDTQRLLTTELRFPASSVRSFALLGAVRRGAVGADAVPTLCEMSRRREPSVRANAGLALAWLGASCEGVDPTQWIARGQSVAVQLAGAAWCAGLERSVAGSAASADSASVDASAPRPLACDARRLARALTRCLDTASDPSLTRACSALRAGALDAPQPRRGATLDVEVVLDARPAARRLVSVRFADGASLIVPTDDAGRVVMRLDRVADLEGEHVVIEDPYATVLER